MIDISTFHNILSEKDVNFFTGVPDSLLKDFCAYITDNLKKTEHIIAVNEGAAVGIAAGYHLATGKIPLVYMQNSGIGNAINPLLSLVDNKVYNIPMLLLVGWRGEPGVKDEPQHIKQGEVTVELFEAMKIPYLILDREESNALNQLKFAIEQTKISSSPFAVIIRANTFSKYKFLKKPANSYSLSREDALKYVIDSINSTDIIVSTTGKLSRELFEYRELLNSGHSNDFLTVGSMGHSSSIALGIALNVPNRNIFCFDGDGALLMHMGSIATIGSFSPKNFRHIVFNNGAHESVGGQPTIGFNLDLEKIALGSGYKKYFLATTQDEITTAMKRLADFSDLALLEIRINLNSRDDLGRPTVIPIDNKRDLMKTIQNN